MVLIGNKFVKLQKQQIILRDSEKKKKFVFQTVFCGVPKKQDCKFFTGCIQNYYLGHFSLKPGF
ncbi:hypothetical protein MXB_2709 [Myxobolus squamalis]|nr:hypothetical protein MXB_2709 [Myxobolus squamalis]